MRNGQLNSDPVHAPRVLLVEDESSIADPFAQALTRNGFATVVARTAASASSSPNTEQPDVILLDLTLPDGDGIDRLPRAQADSLTSRSSC